MGRRTIAILATTLLVPCAAAQDPVYALTPVHFPVLDVKGINAHGDIIGSHISSDVQYAYVADYDYFAPFGRWFGLSNSSALAINDNLEVVGDFFEFGGGARFSFHYDDLTQRLTVLPGLGGGHNNTRGLNNQGQVVGSSATLRGETHAFLWDGVDILDINPFDAAYSTTRGHQRRRSRSRSIWRGGCGSDVRVCRWRPNGPGFAGWAAKCKGNQHLE